MLAEGQYIGSYRVVRELGRGGMGSVYEVVHQELGRRAAIKVLHAQFSHDPQFASRFFNEARAVSIIDHPGVVEVLDFGRLPDDSTYIVMEFLKGESLKARMERARGPLGPEALNLARQIASAVCAAHDKGIVHRDLKPDNVMIVPDPEAPGGERAKVLDFGIAKVAEEAQRPDADVVKTEVGALLGTPAYMAPEQCRGAAAVDAKADVYSLGVILFQLLSGKLPFEGQGPGMIMAMHLMREPPPLREVEASVPPEVAELVHAMLRKDPTERPNMAQVVAELERLGAARTTRMAAAVASGSTPVAGSRSEPGLAPTGVAGSLHSMPNPGATENSGGTGTFAERNPSARMAGIVGALAAAAVLLGIGVVMRRDHPQKDTVVMTTHPVGEVTLPAAPGAIPGSTPGSKKIRWTLHSNPEGADVVRLRDNQVLGQTPWDGELDRGDVDLQIELRREGFFPKPLRLGLSQDGSRTEVLVPKSDEKIPLLN